MMIILYKQMYEYKNHTELVFTCSEIETYKLKSLPTNDFRKIT